MRWITRPLAEEALLRAIRRYPVTVLLGPRQCGKTTLARQFVSFDSREYFDLENPVDIVKLTTEPMNILAELKGTVVIDEIQREPQLFPILRVLADRKPLQAKFLILGSASPDLIKHSSESLAGRLARVEIGGFSLGEVGIKHKDRLWARGSFPGSYLAASENESLAWRKDYIQSFVERDLPGHGMNLPSSTLLRFWTMLAHSHGQIFNAAELAGSLGIGEMTVKRYLDIFSGVYMIRQLNAWHANLKKRQIKSPKIYIRDTGILHSLLGIRSHRDLLSHPKCGASWEGFVIEEAIRHVRPDEVYFWGTHNGAELDLLLIKNGIKYGIECKKSDAPALTPSIKIAMDELGLDRLAVIYPGKQRYSLTKHVEVVPISALNELKFG